MRRPIPIPTRPDEHDELPTRCSQCPPLPDGVGCPRPAWLDWLFECAFFCAAIVVVGTLFVLVGYGIQHWLSRIVWTP